MLFKTSLTQRHEIEIKPPIFWKHETYAWFVGFLDEKTVCKVTILSDGTVFVANGSPESLESSVLEANRDYNLTTEQEFLREYEDALSAISLSPKMEIDTGRDEAVAMYQRENAV